MTPKTILLLVIISGCCQLAGAVLSLLGMRYRYAEKPRLILNAEWGLVAILLAATVTTTMQAANIIAIPAIAKQVWLPTVAWRMLFLWVPLNYYRYTQELKRKDYANGKLH